MAIIEGPGDEFPNSGAKNYIHRRKEGIGSNGALVHSFLMQPDPMDTAQIFQLHTFLNDFGTEGDEASALNYILGHSDAEQEQATVAIQLLWSRLDRAAEHSRLYRAFVELRIGSGQIDDLVRTACGAETAFPAPRHEDLQQFNKIKKQLVEKIIAGSLDEAAALEVIGPWMRFILPKKLSEFLAALA